MRLRNSLNQPLRMMRASDKCLRLSAKLMPLRLLSNTRTMCHCVAVSLLMLLLLTAVAVSTLTCGGGVDCAVIRESVGRLPTKMMIGLTYDETKYLPSDPNWKGRIPAWIGLDGRMRVPPSPQSQIMTTTGNKELSAAGSHVDDYGVIVPIGGGGGAAAADNDDEAAVMQQFVPSLRWASAGLLMQEDKRADRNDNKQRRSSSSSRGMTSRSSSATGRDFTCPLSPPILCLIDFLTPSIVHGDGSDVFSYELWGFNDNEGTKYNHSGIELSPNCYFRDSDESNYLICNKAAADDSIPQPLPDILDGFEMRQTSLGCIRANQFAGMHVTSLILDENKIRGVALNTFTGVEGVQKLSLERNKIQVVFWEAFQGLDSLLILSLRGNSINLTSAGMTEIIKSPPSSSSTANNSNNFVLDSDSSPLLPSLKYLNLAENPLGHLNEFVFWHLSQSPIQELNLQSCSLSFIHKDAFAPLTSLLHVDFFNNTLLIPFFMGLNENVPPILPASIRQVGLGSISLLPQSQLPYPLLTQGGANDSITTINLSGNNYIQLTSTLLRASLSGIVTIVMEKCNIASITPGAFKNLKSLVHLYLAKNAITSIAPHVFPPSLALLSIRQNPMNVDPNQPNQQPNQQFNLQDHFLDGMPNLEWLDMNYMQLGELKEGLPFAGAEQLVFLQMRGAGVTTIAPAAFANLNQLLMMDLGDNRGIRTLPPRFSEGLVKLQMFFIDGSALDQMPSSSTLTTAGGDGADGGESPFRDLTNLTMLYMFNTDIRTLDTNLLANLTNLRALVVSYNKLRTWQRGTTASLSPDLAIDASNNKINYLPEGTFEEFANLSGLDLSDNAFICDCQTMDLQRLASDESKVQLLHWDDLNSYTCNDKGKIKSIQLMSEDEFYCDTQIGDGSSTTGSSSSSSSSSSSMPSLTTSSPPPDGGDNTNKPSSSLLTSIIGSVVAVSLVIFTAGTCYYKRASVRQTWFYYRYRHHYDANKILSSAWSSSLSSSKSSSSSFSSASTTTTSTSLGDGGEDYEFDAFISFNEHDRPWVYTHLVPKLERNSSSSSSSKSSLQLDSTADDEGSNHKSEASLPSFRLCLHDRDFTVGQRITDNIIENIAKSRKVVIVLSRSYVESKWCQFELHLSQHRLLDTDRRDALVLVVLEDVPKQQQNAGLRYLIRTRTYLAWRNDIEGQRLFWRRLYDVLSAPSSNKSSSSSSSSSLQQQQKQQRSEKRESITRL